MQFSSVNAWNCIWVRGWFASAFSIFSSEESICGQRKLCSTREQKLLLQTAEKETVASSSEYSPKCSSFTVINARRPSSTKWKKKLKKQNPQPVFCFGFPLVDGSPNKALALFTLGKGSSRPASEEPLTDTGSNVNTLTKRRVRLGQLQKKPTEANSKNWEKCTNPETETKPNPNHPDYPQPHYPPFSHHSPSCWHLSSSINVGTVFLGLWNHQGIKRHCHCQERSLLHRLLQRNRPTLRHCFAPGGLRGGLRSGDENDLWGRISI